MMEGLESNDKLNSVELNLSSNVIGPLGCHVIEAHVGSLGCVASLDISDNGV